jgi:hypothetical protein
MDQDIKDRWVAALRSGEYAQGHTRLRTDDDIPKYCCLGVLCRIVGLPISEDGMSIDGEKFGGYWALGRFMSNEQMTVLWNMNDGLDTCTRVHSFEEIADYIEKNL